MKIKTDRAWNLQTKQENDWVDILEHHEGSEGEPPYVCIPYEAIDEVVLALLKAKKKIGKRGR